MESLNSFSFFKATIIDFRKRCYGDGSPFCAPGSFAVAEEVICVLHKIYEQPFWKPKLEDHLLDICQTLTNLAEEKNTVRFL